MTTRLVIALLGALAAWGTSLVPHRDASASAERQVDSRATAVPVPSLARELSFPALAASRRADPPWFSGAAASDSARAELAAGRYWHATRILRTEGAARGAPEDVLLLAHAEAGWGHWSAVLELLEGATWVEERGGSDGLYLLGRALEDAKKWADAADAYRRHAALVGAQSEEASGALSRRARALWAAGNRQEALATLARLETAPDVRSWSAAELMLAAASEGDTAAVQALTHHVSEPVARSVVWRAEADARLVARDSAGAEAAFRRFLGADDVRRRAEAATEVGRLRLAARDSAQARTLLRQGFRDGAGATTARAAEGLVAVGGIETDVLVEVARTLDRAGDGARALLAYDRAVRLAASGGGPVPEWARVERARLMGTVRPRQEEALAEFRAIRETTRDTRVGARNLDVWRAMRQRQGLADQAATVRRWLVEEYPGSPEATEVVWAEGTGAEGRGQFDVALARYAFIARHARTSARAGEGRMRSGQIHLRRGNRRGAAEVFEAYLEDFPEGRRWPEAAYWAGRVRLELGDSARGRAHLERAVRDQPIEYYAAMAADLLDLPYRVDLPEGEGPDEPIWLVESIARLDRLIAAGLERGATTEIEHMRERARGTRGEMLRVAEALIERGLTIDGINIGWALLEQEGGWDKQLLRVTFPFPYRDLIEREAEEWGVDPLMLAALIRQESAFKADIVSRAGAIGLMQVMPPTGAELARRHGPMPFSSALLSSPEVNLHLGSAFFRDMSRRYDNDLPFVLSAYNAGPTRATAWRQFPEAADPLRFTERIPFEETRGYVKNVRRNVALYRALYAEE
jgi:soluble lytic murein transglycosylase